MVAEFLETDEVPEAGAGDPIRGAILPLIEAIFVATHGGSPERAAAMGELMLAVDRIRVALVPRPSLN
jgi:hypothetical protein